MQEVEEADAEQQSDWWSVDEVAREFDVYPETVKRWIRSGRLKASKPGGMRNSKWLIHQQEVERLMAYK